MPHVLANLAVGTPVVLREDNNSLTFTCTTTEPWLLSCGEWVVGLEDRRGGYSLDRITPNTPLLESRAPVDWPDFDTPFAVHQLAADSYQVVDAKGALIAECRFLTDASRIVEACNRLKSTEAFRG